MYSYTCNNKEEKRAKGVSKVTVKKDLKHAHYKSVLFEEKKKVSSMTSIRSHRHKLFCESINKIGLSAFDDKRFLINSVESYAYSHYRINDAKGHQTGNQINKRPPIYVNEISLDQDMDTSLIEEIP